MPLKACFLADWSCIAASKYSIANRHRGRKVGLCQLLIVVHRDLDVTQICSISVSIIPSNNRCNNAFIHQQGHGATKCITSYVPHDGSNVFRKRVPKIIVVAWLNPDVSHLVDHKSLLLAHSCSSFRQPTRPSELV